MAKIEPIGEWDAIAALESAREVLNPEDKILIFIESSSGITKMRAANITLAQCVFRMEQEKYRMLFNEGED